MALLNMIAAAYSPSERSKLDFQEERIDLAAAFRTFARLNLNEGVANHFSLVVEWDENNKPLKALVNPANRGFQNMKASDLVLMDVSSKEGILRTMQEKGTDWTVLNDRSATIDPTAICIHG
jgi:ribulose-5-phosphate 4-epimerase/fuculose-1-phosphate aldolase